METFIVSQTLFGTKQDTELPLNLNYLMSFFIISLAICHILNQLGGDTVTLSTMETHTQLKILTIMK